MALAMRPLPAFLALMALVAILLQAPVRAAAPPLELEVELDPSTRRFKARAVVTPAVRDFAFDLHESLAVTSASAAGKRLRVSAEAAVGSLRRWRVTLPAKADQLRLDYGGTLPALDANLDERGVLARLPPMGSERGSYLPAGSGWYPAPAALFSYRLTVSVPAGQRALVAGRLQSESVPADAAGRYRASFEFSHPADGIDLMVGPWVVRERMLSRPSGGPLRLRTYFFRDLDAIAGLADGYLADTARYLERYGEEIGPYPFSEFSIVASPLPTGLGMPTLTYLGADVLKLPFIRATSLGHEVLHNWWGNGVYADYDKGNWAEGLTTFMADYAYKEAESAEAARAMRLGWLRDFAALPAGDGQSLAAFRSRTHGAAAAVGYGKAAMLFVMLRDLLGEETFRQGIRGFWQQNLFRLASWDTLRDAFEAASGRSLEDFFAQWVERSGGPAVRIAEVEAVPAGGGGGGVSLRLSVEQAAPAYALRLPVEVVFGERSEMRWVGVGARTPSPLARLSRGERGDGEVVREVVTIEVAGQPDGVRLDPDLRLWRVLEPEQLPPILRQWIVARAPRLLHASAAADVREAVAALAKRLFEIPPQVVSTDEFIGSFGNDRSAEPLLLAGLHADVDAMLAAGGLPPRPANLSGRGSALVWTVRRDAGPPVAVISANDAEALRALLRPLPHYGAQSWLVFDGSRALERGVWPAPGRLIPLPR
jgi:aminopeptidase N